MKQILFILSAVVVLTSCCTNKEEYTVTNTLRAPAYPLITIDPYTSGWSFTDNLYDEQVKHWTGTDFPLIGALRVDGEIYRFMGIEDVETMPVLNTSEQAGWIGKYTFTKPAEDWYKLDFDDNKWMQGPAAFGTLEKEPTAKSSWTSTDIWVRRIFELEEDLINKTVYLEYSHDNDVVIHINGIEVVNTGNDCKKNVLLKLPENIKQTLNKGKNIITAHCHDRGGHALIDFGLCIELPGSSYFEKTAVQKSVEVLPTQTIYTFACGNVELMLTFTVPLLINDPELLSRPVNYITYKVESNDSKAHKVELYLEAGTAWALNNINQESESKKFESENLLFLQTGSKEQSILGKKGDNVRIDWGYFYLCADNKNTKTATGDFNQLRGIFTKSGQLNDAVSATPGGKDKLALSRVLGKVKKPVEGYFMLGYDDIYSIQYFHDNLRPYWNKNTDTDIISVFRTAGNDYKKLMKECNEFDKELFKTAVEAGGKEYAELCALAYRQAISAHKLVVAPNGDLLFLSKENFSNSSIGTVDITYPSFPLFLYYNTELAKALLNHIFYYSESGKWIKPYPAHDIGTYPIANGQTYGEDMPVEETGNMLILTAAVAVMEGNAEYAQKHWKTLTTWADYLVEKGLDPDNQLCTDDFAGHLAHNANLSVKAILAIASYGKIAEISGKPDIAEKYISLAHQMALQWMNMADDGDHYRLTFDKSGTWSQKYNLIWDKLLKLDIFPEEVMQKEIQYYLTKQNTYGLPLDSRKAYTKSDWIMWTATLASDSETFREFILPVHKFMDETTDRAPMTDWYWTDRPEKCIFQARSVVGGYFLKMLEKEILNN